MGENNWMTSEGLDLNLDFFSSSKSVPFAVSWGDSFNGELISYSSKKRRLQFRVKMFPSLFEELEKAPSQARIVSSSTDYTISWDSYNYSLTNISEYITITIEEQE